MFEKHEAFLLSSKSDIIFRSVSPVNMEDLFENTIFTNQQIDQLINYNYEKGFYITKNALLSLLKRITADKFNEVDILYFGKDFILHNRYEEENFLFEVKKEFLFNNENKK